MPTATITSKGQVTIPKQIRDHLRLAEGDRVEFRVTAEGAVRLQPLSRSARELFGVLRRPGRPAVSLAEMDEAIAAGRERDDRRADRRRRRPV